MASYKEDAMEYKHIKWSAEKTLIAINEFCARHNVTPDKVGIDVFWEDCYLLSDPSKRDPMKYLYWVSTGIDKQFSIQNWVQYQAKNGLNGFAKKGGRN
jgi:hypothetical protein